LLNTTTLFCSISDFAKSAADDIFTRVVEKARLLDGWAALKEDADEIESVIVRSGRNKFILRPLDVWDVKGIARESGHTQRRTVWIPLGRSDVWSMCGRNWEWTWD
jgi:hypothetical protein